MRTPDRPDLITDSRLVTATLLTALAVALPAALVAGATGGRDAAYGALWGVGSVGVNGAAAAWLSARTGRSRRQIGPGTLLMGIPVRIALLAAALALAVGPLGLPATAVALSVCVGELCVVAAQSWVVLHGPSFVGPLD